MKVLCSVIIASLAISIFALPAYSAISTINSLRSSARHTQQLSRFSKPTMAAMQFRAVSTKARSSQLLSSKASLSSLPDDAVFVGTTGIRYSPNPAVTTPGFPATRNSLAARQAVTRERVIIPRMR